MFIILPETHRRVVARAYEESIKHYQLPINKEKLLWGSIAPDFLPKYKIKRHYREESKLFLVKLVISTIRYGKRHRVFETDKLEVIDEFSRKLGLISHYLTDFVCLPHAERWTFNGAMIKHVNYERELNTYSENHEWERVIDRPMLQYDKGNSIVLFSTILSEINEILALYDEEAKGFATDLNYAFDINIRLSAFVLECIEAELYDVATPKTAFACPI